MLQRLNSSLDEELSCGDGLWSREELVEMDARFVAAVERAFELKLESRVAAAATVRVGRNGSRGLAEEAAIGAAWRWFVGAKFEVPAAAVLARVRAGYPNVTAEQVREGFRWRLTAPKCLFDNLDYNLSFLQGCYRNPSLNLTTRMRAAIAALPFESPKLAVTAVVSEQDFATVLDRRLKRIEEMKAKVIEASYQW